MLSRCRCIGLWRRRARHRNRRRANLVLGFAGGFGATAIGFFVHVRGASWLGCVHSVVNFLGCLPCADALRYSYVMKAGHVVILISSRRPGRAS